MDFRNAFTDVPAGKLTHALVESAACVVPHPAPPADYCSCRFARVQEVMTAKLEHLRVTSVDGAEAAESRALTSQHLPVGVVAAYSAASDADLVMQRSLRSVRTPRNTLQKIASTEQAPGQGVSAAKLQDQLLQLRQAGSDAKNESQQGMHQSSDQGAPLSGMDTLSPGKTAGRHSYKPGGSGQKKGGLKSSQGVQSPGINLSRHASQTWSHNIEHHKPCFEIA